MGFLSFLGAEKRAQVEPADATTTGELMGWTSGDDDGAALAPEAALAVSAVFACVRLLSDTLATTPVDSFSRQANGARAEYPRPLWLDQPNPETRKIEFIASVMTSLLLEGNAYLLVTRAGGRVVALDVIPASAVDPRYVTEYGRPRRLVYQISAVGEDGTVQVVGVLERADVLHLKGITLAGKITGVSPVEAARRTLGLSIAAQDFGAELFEHGATPGAVISVPGTMTPQGLRAARQTWRTIHGGAGNRHGLAILTENATFQKVTISPDEAQFLETRAFQVADVARIFGVPPHLIADASGSTSWGSGLAEQNTAFVQFAVRAWAERLEEAFTALLGDEGRRARAFVKFNLDALQRGAIKERMESYRTGLQNGIYSRDEVRALEDLPPDPSGYGGYLMVPTNLAMLTPDGPVLLSSNAGSNQSTSDGQAPAESDTDDTAQQRTHSPRELAFADQGDVSVSAEREGTA